MSVMVAWGVALWPQALVASNDYSDYHNDLIAPEGPPRAVGACQGP